MTTQRSMQENRLFSIRAAPSCRPLTAGGYPSFPGPSRGRCSCSCSVQFFLEQRFAEELRDQQLKNPTKKKEKQ